MNRTYIFASILLGIFLLPVIFIIWDDNIDPPFISNSVYDFLVLKVIPVIAGVVSIVFFVVGLKNIIVATIISKPLKADLQNMGNSEP